jgi:FkbM family methyltransferase
MSIFGTVAPEVRNALDDWMLRAALAATLARDSVAIDVGAHSGDVLRGILRIAPDGHHVAFEPLPNMAAALRSSFPDVDVRELALSDSTGTASFVHVVNDPAYSGLKERTYPAGSGDALQQVTVKLARLDDEIGDLEPDFIKIDVEGAELQVLRGAVETLTRFRPVLWFEHGTGAADHYGTTPGEVWDLLSEVGLDRIYDANAVGPLSRGEFEETFAQGVMWNYLARSGEAAQVRSDSAIVRVPKAPVIQLGRNEPCWCGSGQKFKKCHGG